MVLFDSAVGVVALIAGAIASVAGFGIGSLLTPLLSLRVEMRLAVALVSVPHVAATLLRFWQLRGRVTRRVFLTFGLASAAGGLAGAVLHMWLTSWILTIILAALLIFAGAIGLSGLADRIRLQGPAGWIAGALSGIFGGLVGNQGGIRSAALLGFDLSREAFVATATAIALIIDGVRMPVYLATQGQAMGHEWLYLVISTVGVLVGTLLGRSLLRRIPEQIFRRAVASIIFALGIGLLLEALLTR